MKLINLYLVKCQFLHPEQIHTLWWVAFPFAMDVSSWIYEWIDEECFCCYWNHHSSVQVHPISLPLIFSPISLIWSGSSLISGFFSAPPHNLVLISLLAIGPDFPQISIVQNTCLFYLSIYIPAEYIMLIVHRNANESNLLSWTYCCSGVVVPSIC